MRQCASYSHVFPMAGSALGRFLLPLLHLVNHDGLAPNIAVQKDAAAGVFKGVALRDIAAGEQVTYRRACMLLRALRTVDRLSHWRACSLKYALQAIDFMWWLTGSCDSAASSRR